MDGYTATGVSMGRTQGRQHVGREQTVADLLPQLMALRPKLRDYLGEYVKVRPRCGRWWE